MSIKSIYLPTIALSLIERSHAVVQKNEEAAQEALSLPILATAGTLFALFGRAAFMLSQVRISMTSLLMYSLMGFGAGISVSSPAIYSFFSKMQNRENVIKIKEAARTWANGCI
jgi:hypothetical protein